MCGSWDFKFHLISRILFTPPFQCMSYELQTFLALESKIADGQNIHLLNIYTAHKIYVFYLNGRFRPHVRELKWRHFLRLTPPNNSNSVYSLYLTAEQGQKWSEQTSDDLRDGRVAPFFALSQYWRPEGIEGRTLRVTSQSRDSALPRHPLPPAHTPNLWRQRQLGFDTLRQSETLRSSFPLFPSVNTTQHCPLSRPTIQSRATSLI